MRTIGGISLPILKALHAQFQEDYYYTWNSFKHNNAWAYKVYEKSFKTNKRVMCAETPLIGRDQFNRNDPNTYYRIGIDIVSEYLGYNFPAPYTPDTSRLHNILDKTNIELMPWRNNGSYIVYAMQVPGDSALAGLDIFAAAQYHLILLRRNTKRKIYITMHPDIKKQWGKLEMDNNKAHYTDFMRVVSMVNAEITDIPTNTLLDDAWATVCYTSGVSFDSIAKGVPSFAIGENSFVRPLCGTSLYEIEYPLKKERLSWLSKIAYCQWTVNEVNSGTYKEHIERHKHDSK